MIYPPIDVWIIHLDELTQTYQDNLDLLSDSEKERQAHFASQVDKERYTAAHAGLHRILAGYLKIDPADIPFSLNKHGKPFIKPGCNPAQLEFNLSHSAGLALVAASFMRPVGVDVERVKSLAGHLKLAERYFTPAEINALNNLDPAVSSNAFIQLWAGKEAFIKARGCGLNLPLNQFSLDALISQPGGSTCTVVDPENRKTWWVSPLSLDEGYVGAICAEGQLDRSSVFMKKV